MSDPLSRRTFVGGLALAAAGVAASPAFALQAKPSLPGGFVMWHSPGCGCCLEWAKRMEAAFERRLPVVEADMAVIKRARGVPADLHSCHTALVGGYVIEGHVPPPDVRRLVASRSRSIRGLAVPGMPAGSPGMDVGHRRKEPFDVLAFGSAVRPSVFARYR